MKSLLEQIIPKSQKKIVLYFMFQPSPPSYKFHNGNIHLLKRNFIVRSQPDYQIKTYNVFFKSQIDNKQHHISLIHIKRKNPFNEMNLNCIFYIHGNSADIGTTILFLLRISQIYQVSVISYDPRGYGCSSKIKINEQSTFEDADVAMAFAFRLQYVEKQLIIWGYSMGSGAAVELSTKHNFLGLVLECPLASANHMFDKNIQEQTKNNLYDSYNKINRIKSSIIILHGKLDRIIPSWHSELLFQRCLENRLASEASIELVLIEGVGHSDVRKLVENTRSATFKQFRAWLVSLDCLDRRVKFSTSLLDEGLPILDDDFKFTESEIPSLFDIQSPVSQIKVCTQYEWKFDLEMEQFNLKRPEKLQFVKNL